MDQTEKVVDPRAYEGGPPSPFVNDPFAFIWLAFKNLYPDKKCVCQWTPNKADLTDEEGKAAYGVTDTDEQTGLVSVLVSATGMNVNDAAEVFAHELAHVATGVPAPGEDEHGERWKAAFDAIFNEYNRVMSSIFGADAAQKPPEEAVSNA